MSSTALLDEVSPSNYFTEIEEHFRQARGSRSKMTAEQLALLEKQYLERQYLERRGLPRLSLFYLS